MSLVTDEEAAAFLQAELGDGARSRTMAFADAWERVVTLILDRLGIPAGEPGETQRALAGQIVAAWRAILPFTMVEPEAEFPFSGEALGVLRQYYLHAENLRTLVRVMAVPLYRGRKERTEVLEQLDSIQEFCRASLADIDGIAGTYEVLVTGAGFQALAERHQDLLDITLGAALTEEFAASYDSAVDTMKSLLKLDRITGPAN